MPRIHAVAAVAALLAPSLAPFPASAQGLDDVRSRAGLGLNGGGMVVGGGVAKDFGAGGIAALQGQLGAQAGDRLAVYAMPEVGMFFGSDRRASFAGLGFMFEYTFDDFPASIGAGLYAGFLTGPPPDPSRAAWEVFAGGRIRSAFYPLVGRYGAHRRGLFLGVDVGVYAPFTASGFVLISPTASVGYQAF